MKDKLIKYLNGKIRSLSNELKSEEYFELKDLENFLNILEEIKEENKDESNILYNNRYLIRRVNSRYNLVNQDSFELFISFIRDLYYKKAGFSSQNYKYINNILNVIYNKEDILYDKYFYLDSLSKKKERETLDLQIEKLELEDLKNKLENNKVITNDYFVYYIVNDKLYDAKYKTKLLCELNSYNKAALKNYIPLNVSNVIDIFNEFGYRVSNNSYLTNICANYSLGVLTDILDLIKNLKLDFKEDVLLLILSSGTSCKIIKESYLKIMKDNNYNLNSALNIPSFWSDNKNKYSVNERIVSSVESSKNEIKNNVNSSMNPVLISSNEAFKTAEYLKKYSFYNKDFSKMKGLLNIPVSRIMKTENLLSLYGVDLTKLDSSTALSSINNITTLDQWIELDLADYIMMHLSSISVGKNFTKRIYDYKKSGKSVSNIKNGKEYLSNELRDDNRSTKQLYDDIGLSSIELENRDMYDEMLSINNPNKIIPTIYKNNIINYLEKEYRINELQYKIGDFIYSRKKVLRLASSLVEEGEITLDKFLYIMTYQKLANESDVRKIEEELCEVYALAKENIK